MDILVEFLPQISVTLLNVCAVKCRMEELLNTPVDVITLPVPKNPILEICFYIDK